MLLKALTESQPCVYGGFKVLLEWLYGGLWMNWCTETIDFYTLWCSLLADFCTVARGDERHSLNTFRLSSTHNATCSYLDYSYTMFSLHRIVNLSLHRIRM